MRRHEILQLLRKEIGGLYPLANSLSDLPDAIRANAGGGKWLDPRFTKLLVDAMSGEKADTGLSPNERAVAQLVTEGCTNKEIGRRLAISEAAVKATLQRLFRKTGTRSRTQLVRAALEQLREDLIR